MLRSVLAVFLGCLLAVVVMMAIQSLNFVWIHPAPAGKMFDEEAMKVHSENAPVAALLVVLASNYAGVFSGTWFATWFARLGKRTCALIVTGLFLLTEYFMLRTIPHPAWYGFADLLGIAACGHVAYNLATGRKAWTL